MTTAPVPAPPAQPTVLRRAGLVVATTIAILNSLFWTLMDATYAVMRFDDVDTEVVWWLVYVLIGVGVATALVWRRAHPLWVCVGTAAAVVVAPVGFFAPWWALVWVFITRRWRDVAFASTATAAAIAATFWRDHARGADAMLAFAEETGGGSVQLATPGYVGLGVLSLGVAVAIGLVRRYRATARAARHAEQVSTRAADELRTELSRQEERDLIAREMHDTVAHHLSLVSLHASALEVTATDPGTDVPGAARSMRSSAHKALEEMRTLITNLREPSGSPHLTGTDRGLDELPALVEDARRAGAVIAPTIYITGAEQAPLTLTRAVYRIVQESLTNALKHAPGAPVLLDVRAAPGRGVQITVTNPLPAASSAHGQAYGGGRAETPGGGVNAEDGNGRSARFGGGYGGAQPGGYGGHDASHGYGTQSGGYGQHGGYGYGGGPGYATGTDYPGGAGAGQRGMAERVHALGGTFQVGPEGDAYVVQAQLPWPQGPVTHGVAGA